MKSKWFFRILAIFGAVLFAALAFIIVRSTATTTAVVPNQPISAGTRIEASMLKVINIPVDTPKGYITDMNSLLGQKIKVSAEVDQLLYPNAFMASWDDFAEGKQIPEDYVVTAMKISSDRAVGGLITAGDYVDVLGVPKASYLQLDHNIFNSFVGPIADTSYGTNEGANLYWILANVLILETDSTLSDADQSSLSGIIDGEGEGSYYVVALSYSDYQKLRLSEIYFELWLNIVPEQNDVNGPMIDEMRYSYLQPLMDAMAQSKFDEEGNRMSPEASKEERDEGLKKWLEESKLNGVVPQSPGPLVDAQPTEGNEQN